MRRDGAAARPIQRKRRNQVRLPGGAAAAGGNCDGALGWASATRQPGPRLAVMAVSTFAGGGGAAGISAGGASASGGAGAGFHTKKTQPATSSANRDRKSVV